MDDILQPQITTHHTYFPSPLPGAPSFSANLTRLKDTYFLWLGSGPPSSVANGSLENEQGEEGHTSEKKLAGEWAVAMPAIGSMPITSTALYRSTGESEPIAQRLARKFPGNQIHVSLSLAPSGSLQDPLASKALMLVEKRVAEWISNLGI
ncbi:hypothetical protein M231_04150 [Tremella mesenterica]|uniref:Proteasome assembly chaperone 4 n=1 Tax=Tremella mesenterica TaxID=5217 RepID=A0A4Q1BL63_TREME|nr:hypothetical protein M231_04150 [Tremella mesenterica]